jgi:hypothetical protein
LRIKQGQVLLLCGDPFWRHNVREQLSSLDGHEWRSHVQPRHGARDSRLHDLNASLVNDYASHRTHALFDGMFLDLAEPDTQVLYKP